MKIKFSHERHEAHEDAQAFKRGDRRPLFVNFVLLQNRMFGLLNSIFQGVVMFNLNTRNHENISLAESAEFAETNLKVD